MCHKGQCFIVFRLLLLPFVTWIVRFVSQRSVFYSVLPVSATLCVMNWSFCVTKVSVLSCFACFCYPLCHELVVSCHKGQCFIVFCMFLLPFVTWNARFVSQRSVFYSVLPVSATLCFMNWSFRVTKVSVLSCFACFCYPLCHELLVSCHKGQCFIVFCLFLLPFVS